MNHILLVSCAEHMQSGTSSEPDDQILMAALEARGLLVRAASWDDPTVDWAAAPLVIVRSAWDYHHSLVRFLRWAEGVARVTALWNPLPLLQWNTRKTYLRDLEGVGVPTVATEWLEAGTAVDLARLLERRGWQQAVMKPMVSTNAYGTRLLNRALLAESQAHLEHLLASRDVMLQPFLPDTGGYGERSLVFIDGELTHAYRKRAALEHALDRFGELPVTPTQREATLARTILQRAAELIEWGDDAPSFLFARVDLVQDEDGTPHLMELELVEPRLRLADAPWALARLIRAVERRWRAISPPLLPEAYTSWPGFSPSAGLGVFGLDSFPTVAHLQP